MVAGQQHGRHRPAAKLGGTSVLRVFEGAAKPGRERVAGDTVGVRHGAVDLAHDGIEQDLGGDLAPGQHVGTNGHAVGDQLRHAFVNALVAPAEHAEVAGGELAGQRVVELTPPWRQLDDPLATELAAGDLCVLCGRYEGIDERVSHLVTDRVSIGPYVLSGGEIAAQVLLDAVVRKIDGAVSNPASVAGDSFSPGLGGALEYPQYTRPAEFRGWPVPAVLLSGDHGAVERWRRERLGGGEAPQ